VRALELQVDVAEAVQVQIRIRRRRDRETQSYVNIYHIRGGGRSRLSPFAWGHTTALSALMWSQVEATFGS
jgi:hypothetical protein